MKALSLECLLGLMLLVVSGFAQETDPEEQLLRRRMFDRPKGAERFDWKQRALQTPEAFSKTALAAPNFASKKAPAWVRHYASGLNPSIDVPKAMAVDDFGNVYVTGHSSSPDLGADYVTLKYNSAGAKIWEARFNGEGNGDDLPFALCVDEAGNVYVAGASFSAGTSNDYATIKYDVNGAEQWVAHYNSPTNDADVSVAIGVDEAANIYVTGWSSNTGWSAFTAIKYASAAVAVEEEEHAAPAGFHLSQNYPNPFNPTTTIAYTLRRAEHVTLRVFDLLGKEAATLVDASLPAGRYHAIWEAKDMESGVYFYRLQVGSFAQTRRLTLLQ